MFGIKEDLDVHLLTHHVQIPPKETGNQPMRINCDQCQYFAEDVSTFVRHIRNMHTAEHCQYCEFVAKDRENLQSHMIMEHEEFVILHTMAKQVNDMSDNFEGFETFKKGFETF